MADSSAPSKPEKSRRRLSIPAELGALDRAREFLTESLRDAGLSEDEFFRLEVALVELCVNITRYAYPAGGGTITLTADTAPSVFLEIRDSGRPFDPRLLATPDLEGILKEGRRGGLGVFLARTLVEDFDYRREGQENVVTLLHGQAGSAKNQ